MQEEKCSELNFSGRLKSLMDIKGLRQKELARLIGVSEGTVSNWISKESTPKVEALHKLEVLFKVSGQFLLTGKMPSGKRFIDRAVDELKEESLLVEAARLEKVQKELAEITSNIIRIGRTRASE
jgi:transcriptional regulator with XRE-family HTH domain